MNLTEVSFYIRKFAPFALIGFLVLLVFVYLIKVLIFLIPAQSPSNVVTTYTNPIFGKIKTPELPSASSSAGFTYKLDTIEGVPVTATTTAQIIFLPPTATRFGYREKIYLMAKAVGFDTENVKHKLEGKVALFLDDKQKMTIDITNFNFTYEYNYKNDPSVFSNLTIPDRQEIERKAVELLKALGRYPDELARGKINIIYFAYNFLSNTLSVTANPEEANVVEVDFYRPDIDGAPAPYPIVSPDYFNSQNHVILLFNDTGFKVLKAQVKFFEKSDTQIGVYPLRSAETAWEELKSGKGYVVSTPGVTRDVIIKKMFLGYLDPEIYLEYLQPVYVFLGDDNYVGYVPAVASEFADK